MSDVNTVSRNKRKRESLAKGVLKRLARNKLAMAGGIIMVVIILAAIFAPWLTPYTY